ncbi:MAG: COG4223 family protein [Geminicoccaceae bacterium]
MARNRGKRPGAASGSSSPSQDQARDAEVKADDALAGGKADQNAPAAASSSNAAQVGVPTVGAGTTTSAAKPSSDASKAGSSAAKTTAAGTTASTATSTQAGGSTKPSSAAASRGTAAAGSSGGQHGGPSSVGGNGSFWPGLIGGVIGGAATALAASLFWMDGDEKAATVLESRLAAAEQQVQQIDALNDRVAAVEAAPGTSLSGQEGDMAERLAELETQLATDRFATLEQQLQELSSKMQSASEAQQSSSETVAELSNSLSTLETISTDTGKLVDETDQTVASLGATAKQLSDDVQTLAARIDDAESRLDHLGGEYQRGAAMIVAIGDINQAVTEAEPFAGPLETLKSLVRDDATLGETLSTLESMAADGVPTLKGLKETFGQMASRVLLAEEGDQSLTDQVGNNVFGIFNIRPAGADVEGSGSRAVLARAQSKLSTDDLGGAILELGGLEGQGAEEATAWIERAGARLAAEAAVVDLRSHAQALVAKGA